LCLLMGELRSPTFIVIIETYVVILVIVFVMFYSFLILICLSTYLVRLFFPVFSWLHLSSSSVCRILLSIFCRVGLIVMNSFSFCLSSGFYFLNFEGQFCWYSGLSWQLFSFRAWNMSVPCPPWF
jgi:hypothetical protein